MIQLIMKDGTKKRVTKMPKRGYESIGINPDDIAHEKELTESEILKIPEVVKGKLAMRDKNSDELKVISDNEKLKSEQAIIEQKIQDEIRQRAIDSLKSRGEIE